jgi:hypothetical protein
MCFPWTSGGRKSWTGGVGGKARKPVCHGFNRGVGVLLIKPFGEQALVNVVDEALNPK